jgi:hypothetical protein
MAAFVYSTPIRCRVKGCSFQWTHGCTHDLFKDKCFTDYIERIQRFPEKTL